MDQARRTDARWTPLRIAIVIAAMLGVLFWAGVVVWWWRIPDARRDGFELMGLMLATAHLVCLVLPALFLGFLGRWLQIAAAFLIVSLALASDTLIPWLPWHWLSR